MNDTEINYQLRWEAFYHLQALILIQEQDDKNICKYIPKIKEKVFKRSLCWREI